MMGYCPWSAIDLISTHEGIKTLWLYYVDRDEFDLKTLDRYRKIHSIGIKSHCF